MSGVLDSVDVMSHTSWDAGQRAVIELDSAASGTVIGAPGSGKTAVLVERVARLLGGPAPLGPGEVLVLTPSRASATRLRDRLGMRVAVATPGPLARSVGSFAFQIVRAEAAANGDRPPELLTGAEQDRLLAQLIEGDIIDRRIAWPAHLGEGVRRSRQFRSEVRAFLDEAIELDASRSELRALRDGEWIPVVDLLAEYAAVVQRMRTTALSASELTGLAVEALRSAQHVPEVDRLRVVLVDDAQELTRGGIALVAALRERGIAVLAAGDPDIASGAFRGITPQMFGELARALGDVHVLHDQHRSHEELAWLVRHLTQTIGTAGRVEHRRAPGPAPEEWQRVTTLRASSPGEEADLIARRLRELRLAHGVPWGRMAVIAHDTRQLVALDAELAARDVPTRAAGVPRPLGSERAVRQIMEIVRLGLTPVPDRDVDALIEALRTPFGGFDGVWLRRLRSALRHAELESGGSRPARELLREGFAHPVLFAILDTIEGRAAERFASTLAQLATMAEAGATVHDLLWHVWERSRLADRWHRVATTPGPLAGEISRALDGLVALFDAAKRAIERSPNDGPHRFIRDILDSDVPEDTLSAPEREATVTLLTPANALSTEFDTVVIAGLQDGVWPNTRLRGGILGSWRLADTVRSAREGRRLVEEQLIDRRRQALHDELRLFVRAASRAVNRLIVTAVDNDDQTPSPLFSRLPPATPQTPHDEHPLTLRGLVAKHRRTLTSSSDDRARAEAAGQLRILAENGVAGARADEWYGVREASTCAPLVDLEQTYVAVSPSQIDDFAECGLGWVIGALGGDVVTSPSAGIGTLLHAALERVPGGGIEQMRAVLDERWGELDFEAPWIAARERRRAEQYLEHLDSYLAHVALQQGRVLSSEGGFRLAVSIADEQVVSGGELYAAGNAVVAGYIDRVEEYPRASGDHAAARRGERGSKTAWDAMSAADESEGHRVVVVDLKTGKGEERTSDARVEDDAQLAAYQLAVEQGLIAGADPAALAGARLVVVSKTIGESLYRVAHQHTLRGESREKFLHAVAEAARGMSAASFVAAVETHCQGQRMAPICRIHTIGAVSS